MRKLTLFLATAAAGITAPALAQPIAMGGEGAPIIVTSLSNVVATYLGTTASFSDDLYLIRPGNSDLFLFNNQTSAVGSTIDLGSFALGTELVFRLEVHDFGGNTINYFSGSALRNPDGGAHSRVDNNYLMPGTTLVSFEDLPRDTDSSFNDLSFSFSGTSAGAVPEPAGWALMIGGIGLVGGAMRRRGKQAVRVTYA